MSTEKTIQRKNKRSQTSEAKFDDKICPKIPCFNKPSASKSHLAGLETRSHWGSHHTPPHLLRLQDPPNREKPIPQYFFLNLFMGPTEASSPIPLPPLNPSRATTSHYENNEWPTTFDKHKYQSKVLTSDL